MHSLLTLFSSSVQLLINTNSKSANHIAAAECISAHKLLPFDNSNNSSFISTFLSNQGHFAAHADVMGVKSNTHNRFSDKKLNSIETKLK